MFWRVTHTHPKYKRAIEWLKNTISNINFYLIELKVHRIGESLLDPKFESVEIPNDLVKNTNAKFSDKILNRLQIRLNKRLFYG